MRSAAWSNEGGAAIILAMMGLLIMSALSLALVLGTSAETAIARNFRGAAASGYGAETILQYGLEQLAEVPDWSLVLSGATRSAFTDGSPGGVRRLADGSTIDLNEVVNLANCGRQTMCSEADMNQITAERPWGMNNPRWQLYAFGAFADLAPSASASRLYLLLLAGDDPSEIDGDPVRDGSGAAFGAGVILLRAEAFGPAGAHAVIESTVARVDAAELNRIPGTPPVRIRSWRASR